MNNFSKASPQNIARGMFGNVPPDAILGKSGFAKAALPQYLALTKTAAFQRGFFGTMSKIAMSLGEYASVNTAPDPTPQKPSTPSYPGTDAKPPKTNGMPTSALTPSSDPTKNGARAGALKGLGAMARSQISTGDPGSTAPHGAIQAQ
jgi:hypothetical protein